MQIQLLMNISRYGFVIAESICKCKTLWQQQRVCWRCMWALGGVETPGGRGTGWGKFSARIAIKVLTDTTDVFMKSVLFNKVKALNCRKKIVMMIGAGEVVGAWGKASA